MCGEVTLYSYTVAVDAGFAPNPFHGFCTLACCKPGIRRTAQKGDYVVGIGPKGSGSRVVYAMLVAETLEFDDYWHDRRFHIKRPDFATEGVSALGDNIYHRDRAGEWQQELSQHSLMNGPQDCQLMGQDLSGVNVLVGRNFVYWGGDGPPLPDNLRGLITGRAYRSRSNDRYIPDFIEWFEGHEERGRLGPPTDDVPSQCNTGEGKRQRRC